jgi:putative DNA primase/helicase
MSAERVRLSDRLVGLKANGSGWTARCPAHDDERNSLSITKADDGKILLHCFVGCTPEAIVAAVGLTLADLFPPKNAPVVRRIVATYDYRDADGTLVYQAVRYEPKDFLQRKPDGAGGWVWKTQGIRKLPYRLPDLQGKEVAWVVEGEKDADALWALGLPGTTNSGGADGWGPSETKQLVKAGVRRVIIIPDNDDKGRQHAERVAKHCRTAGLAVSIVELPDLEKKGQDVSDWLALGHTRADLEALASAVPYVVPRQERAPVAATSGTVDADPCAADYHLTDLGNAEAFVARYSGVVRYDHRRGEWLVWKDHYWEAGATTRVRALGHEHVRAWQREAVQIQDYVRRKEVLDFCLRLERSAAFDNMLKEARVKDPIALRGDEWNQDPWLLGCPNGVVDLRTGERRDGRPDDHITMITSAPYDPTADCPRWWQFLREIFRVGDEPDADLIDFVWKLCGYMLTGVTTEQIVVMCHGRGSNGKSLMLNTLSAVLGGYADSLPAGSLQFKRDEGIPNDLAKLVGRRFVTLIESNDGARFNEARLKSLTGEDRISARFLHGEFFNFTPVAKFVIAVNHKPIVKDDSPAFWRRIRLIPFLQTFSGANRDDNLKAILLSESAGILFWAIQGCLEWQKTGLPKPEAVLEATETYRSDSDQLGDFLSSSCDTQDESATCTAAEAFKAYTLWATEQGLGKLDRLTANGLGRLLGERFRRKVTRTGPVYGGVKVLTSRLW